MLFHRPFDPPEDAGFPEKTGAARFGEILEDHYAAVLLINALFVLCCLPVVTLPPALFALYRIARLMALGRTVRSGDYLRAFRRDWKRGYLAFALTALPQALAGVGLRFYLQRAGAQPLFLLPFLFCSTVFLASLLLTPHLYALLDAGCPVRETLRLSLALGLGKPTRSALAALCCSGLPLAAVLLLPLSLVYLLLIGFSLPFLWGSFLLRLVWKQHLDPAIKTQMGFPPEKTEP